MAAIAGHIPVLLQERLRLLRTDLETFRSSLRQEVADGERELATPAAQGDGGIAHGAAADRYERELRLAEITAFKRDQYDVETALGRLGASTYGICVECERSVEREAAP